MNVYYIQPCSKLLLFLNKNRKYEKALDTSKLKSINNAVSKARSNFIDFTSKTKKYKAAVKNSILKINGDLNKINMVDLEF